MQTTSKVPQVFAAGSKVVLRRFMPRDVDRWIHSRTHGKWRHYDAPWEGVHDSLTPEDEAKWRERVLRLSASDRMPTPRAVIAGPDGIMIGSVNAYVAQGTTDELYVGIGIYEDDLWGQGLGTEALWLWVDHLFANTEHHRIGLTTWSFNPGMMRVAEKVGFVPEGVEREVREWQGEHLDRVQYGMLRREWQEKRKMLELGGDS
jgi:RimJ/RimL family protein N-acetyltransferase